MDVSRVKTKAILSRLSTASRTGHLALTLLGLTAAPALAAEPPTLDAFLATHPRYAVLPSPYFEPGKRAANYLDVALKPGAFLGAGARWHAEIAVGDTLVRRVPAAGTSVSRTWSAFLDLGAAPPDHLELRLFGFDHGVSRLAARVTLAPGRRQRFTSIYATGPYTRQQSRLWGEDGASLVLLQLAQPARFDRLTRPVVLVGGDFNYQRIENLVRYFRVHGVAAFGYKPDYDREPGESLLAMGMADRSELKTLLDLAADGGPAHLVGLCLGGIHVRGVEYADRGRVPPLVASLTTVGTPHLGSRLADVYNGVGIFPMMHRLLTGDPRIHRYKDSAADMAAFNQAVGRPRVPTRYVTLDAEGRRLDGRYGLTAGPLRWLTAWEGRRAIASVHTDGLINTEGQALTPAWATWNTDHAGMINDGLAATYFDAYAAHSRLIDSLAVLEARP